MLITIISQGLFSSYDTKEGVWNLATSQEILSLIGCIVYMGINSYPTLEQHWSSKRMVQVFGLRGTLQSFNRFQLHYTVGYVHHGKPSYYKSLYVSEKILSTPPPLPQEFVGTWWSYIYGALTWWRRYGQSCVKLGHKILEVLPKSDSHYSFWEEILQMAANEEIGSHRTLLLEVLDRLVIPGQHDCQGCDGELKFSCGFLARSWPMRLVSDINSTGLMVEEPEFALPLTAGAIADCTAEIPV